VPASDIAASILDFDASERGRPQQAGFALLTPPGVTFLETVRKG